MTTTLVSRMSDTPQKVSEIRQFSTIEVNEEGAEASAVTGISMETCGISAGEETTEFNFFVNRPFLFEIKSEDGTTLFVGVVVSIK